MKRNLRTVSTGSCITRRGNLALAVLTALKSTWYASTCSTRTELNLAHDLPASNPRELPKPPHTAGRYDPCCPSIAEWTPLPRQTGDHFSHRRLAQRVSDAGSGVPRQGDVRDSNGTGIWRSR